MNADKVVGALRSCSNHDTRKPDCDNCPLFGERLCVKKMLEGAADLIESLQAQLERETKSANGWICAANDYRKEAERLKDINKALESDIYNAEMNFDHMAVQLAEAQRREKAAAEDLKLIVDAVREAHCDETCCFACKFDCDTSITDSGCYANECPGFERDDCFEWRGPVAGEERG